MRLAIRATAASTLLISLPAAASDFGAGFLAAMLGLFLIAIWPLILPFFYLRGTSKKVRLYFVLALTAFGFLAILSVPFQLASLIGMQAMFDNSVLPANIPGTGLLYIAHPLAFATSIWALPKVKRLLGSSASAP